MLSVKLTWVLYLICNIFPILADKLCFFKENSKANSTDLYLSSYRLFYVSCNSSNEKCCDKGCCPIENAQVSYFWFMLSLIIFCNVYFILRFSFKKYKNRTMTAPVSISRVNTQPQEVSLMLSFNQPREGLERLHFENLNSTHVPFTPLTPPPPYLTPTPPPTYSVAIHFPPIYRKKIDEKDVIDV